MTAIEAYVKANHEAAQSIIAMRRGEGSLSRLHGLNAKVIRQLAREQLKFGTPF